MGRWSHHMSGNYKKDNSPKAREILRLAQMLLERPDVAHNSAGTSWFATDQLRIQSSKEYPAISALEISIPFRPFHKGSCKLLLKAVSNWKSWCYPTGSSHIVFYDKKMRGLVLDQLHKLMPLEALAYYGSDAKPKSN